MSIRVNTSSSANTDGCKFSAAPFLRGGGRIADLIATFDWSKTLIGRIETWPTTLKASVSLMLRSPVPMILLWGLDGVMIYNDAYTDFAATRHPHILGAKVREGWPEVADFNDHVMKVGLSGETLSFRDQELTLLRSGRPEQVWLDLDYSPVCDERGDPAGVIAIVVETTARVAAERWRSSELERQRQMFEQAPGFMAMMSGRDHVFEITNAAYMQLIEHRDVIGKSVRDAFPDIAGQGWFEILDEVFESGVPFSGASLNVELQATPGSPKLIRHIDLVYQPVRNPAGVVTGIFAQGQDVSDRVIAEHALRRSEAQFRTLAEVMPNHVWTASPDGTIDWFNART